MSEAYIPRSYQTRCTRWLLDHPLSGLFVDPGLGKTAASLQAVLTLWEQLVISRALVIAPLDVCVNVWPLEVGKWDVFNGLRVQILHGNKKDTILHQDADLYVINPEGLPWLAKQDWRWPEELIVDESTKFKHVGTTRFKTLKKMLDHFPRRHILTGTPAPNGLLDLYGQIYILDQGAALGRSYTAYKKEFFVPIHMGPYVKWEIRNDDARQEIYRRIEHLILRVSRAELADDLPEVVQIDVPVELPPAARKLYDTLEKDNCLQLDAGEITRDTAGIKLRQAAAGRIYLDDLPGAAPQAPDGVSGGRGWALVHKAKQKALRALVDELGGKPTLVAYEFKHDVDAVREEFGDDVPLLGGGTSKADKAELVKRWNRGEIPLMLLQPCHGLNLQAGGSTIVWYTLPWDLELYIQTVDRLNRMGQDADRVLVYHLMAAGTCDVRVSAGLGEKDMNQTALLDALDTDARDLM